MSENITEGTKPAIEKIFDEGIELFNSQKYAEAAQKFKEVLALDENTLIAWEDLGHCYVLLEDYDKAITAYNRTISFEPDNIEYIRNLAGACVSAEYYQDALAAYEQIISLNSKDNDAILEAAKCHVILGDFDAATRKLKQTSNLSAEEKETRRSLEASILTFRAQEIWSVIDKEGNRFPSTRRQYTKSRKLLEKAAALNPQEDWAKDELKWTRDTLKRSKKRIFAGSYLIIILTLIFVFFASGGVKGCSWERQKKMTILEASLLADVVPVAVNSLLKNGNFQDVIKMEDNEKFIEKYQDNVNGFHFLASIWLIFLILYLFSARIPLYLSNKRLKKYGRFTKAITGAMDDLQRSDKRWKTTWSDGSVTYDDDYSGTFLSLILMAVSIILTLLLLPLTVILNFLRNYVFYF